MSEVRPSRFGKVRLLKDVCVFGETHPVYKNELWDIKEGAYVDPSGVNCDETIDLQGNPGAKRYVPGRVDHLEGGNWMRKGEVHEVLYVTLKGVRVRTGFDTPHKVQYLHHEDFVWVEKSEAVKGWVIQPEAMYT